MRVLPFPLVFRFFCAFVGLSTVSLCFLLPFDLELNGTRGGGGIWDRGGAAMKVLVCAMIIVLAFCDVRKSKIQNNGLS